jgi:hypothetical protein
LRVVTGDERADAGPATHLVAMTVNFLGNSAPQESRRVVPLNYSAPSKKGTRL